MFDTIITLIIGVVLGGIVILAFQEIRKSWKKNEDDLNKMDLEEIKALNHADYNSLAGFHRADRHKIHALDVTKMPDNIFISLSLSVLSAEQIELISVDQIRGMGGRATWKEFLTCNVLLNLSDNALRALSRDFIFNDHYSDQMPLDQLKILLQRKEALSNKQITAILIALKWHKKKAEDSVESAEKNLKDLPNQQLELEVDKSKHTNGAEMIKSLIDDLKAPTTDEAPNQELDSDDEDETIVGDNDQTHDRTG